MADMLKVTTPIVTKPVQNPNPQQQSAQEKLDLGGNFQLSNLNQVNPGNPNEANNGQHNGLLEKEPTALMDMLKDPSATVSFIKGIFLLQELSRLLPVNNDPFTEEMTQLFDALLVGDGDIISELSRQENNTTLFKGEFFDELRLLVQQDKSPEMRENVANLLKSVNSILRNRDMLGAVSNNLKYLSTALAPSKDLSEKLSNLSNKFAEPTAYKDYTALKKEMFSVFAEVERSVLFSSKLEKLTSITVYNLSRFNSNSDILNMSLGKLFSGIEDQETQTKIYDSIKTYIDTVYDTSSPSKEKSTVMEILTQIISKQSESDEVAPANKEKIETIIHSLLSSPCNYTPLLHFVMPMDIFDIKSFAEIWINPNEGEDVGSKTAERTTRVLVSFDVPEIGVFELEMAVSGTNIDMMLFTPKEYIKEFSILTRTASQIGTATGYKFSSVLVDKLEKQRSLMEVFKTLPNRRAGLDVTI